MKAPFVTLILLSDYRFGDINYFLSLFLEFLPLIGVGGFGYLKDIFAGDLRWSFEEGIKNFAEFNPLLFISGKELFEISAPPFYEEY